MAVPGALRLFGGRRRWESQLAGSNGLQTVPDDFLTVYCLLT